MAFDVKKYMTEIFEPRTEAVPVPSLQSYFGEDEKAVWIVRGLTGREIGNANEVAAKQSVSTKVLEGLLTSHGNQIQDAVKALIGRDGGMSEDMAKRIEHLMCCSVDPKCDLDLALKICKSHPITFLEITNVIVKLSGLGMQQGKPKPSGAMKKSG